MVSEAAIGKIPALTFAAVLEYHAAMPRASFQYNWLFIIIALVACAGGFYRYHGFFHDDAYISLRYVHNFLDGQGLVWNPSERVEGYTNFWFVIMLGAVGLTGISLEIAARILGLASFLGLLALVWTYSRRLEQVRSENSPAVTIPLLVSCTALPLIVWSVGGLETAMFTLFITGGIWFAADALEGSFRKALFAGFLMALATMTRPEGLLFFAITAGFMAALVVARKSGVARQLVAFSIAFGVAYLPALLWRFYYYGGWLPNTWHLKGEFSQIKLFRGLDYLGYYFTSLPYLLPLLVIAALLLTLRRSWNIRSGFIASVLIGFLLYVLYVGGDHMQAFRFFAPIIPSIGLLLLLALQAARLGKSQAVSTVATILVAALSMLQVVLPPERVNRARMVDGAAFMGKVVGEYINNQWPKGSLIALNTAGSTPYFAPNHRFIDMLGLNDKHIARQPLAPRIARHQLLPGHEKGDAAYVLSRRPDYIIAGPSTGDFVGNNWFLTEAQLANSAEFFAHYRDTTVAISVKHIPGYGQYSQSRDGFIYLVYYQRI